MKVLPDIIPSETESPLANAFSLPQGIIGFRDFTRAELLYLPDHLPFLWMKLHSLTDVVHFIVIEPAGFIPGYSPELFEEDALGLGLTDAADAMVLNIVSLQQQRPIEATVNLVGPIVVNRRTKIGRQFVISNYSRYNAHHPLVETPTTTIARATA